MYLASEKATFSAVAETVSILLFAIPYIDTCQINNIIPKRLNPFKHAFRPILQLAGDKLLQEKKAVGDVMTEGEKFATFCEGHEIQNSWGSFWLFSYDLNLNVPAEQDINVLEVFLQAVRGIGPVREKKFRAFGIQTLWDLAKKSPDGLVREDAQRVCEALEIRDWALLLERFPKFKVLSAVPREKLAVIDIETSGFTPALPIFLVGVLTFEPNPKKRIFLARHPVEEPAMLKEAVSVIADKACVITYNGASFDLPMLEKRCNRLDVPFQKPFNVDLLPIVRKLIGQEVPDCKLKTIERIVLQYERYNDPASSEVPEIYQRFFLEQNPDILQDVIDHNKKDLTSLVEIWSYLDERDRHGDFTGRF